MAGGRIVLRVAVERVERSLGPIIPRFREGRPAGVGYRCRGDPIPCRVSVRSSLHSSSPNSAYQRGHGGTGASRPVASFAVLQPVVTPASPVGSLFGSSGEQPSGSVRAEPAGRGSSKIETSKRCNVIRFREQPFRGMRQMRGLDTAVSFSRLVLRCIRTIVG